MSNLDTAQAALVNALTGPRRVTGDAGSVEQFTLAELIAANNYLQAQAAGATRNRGLRFNRLVPPGTSGRGGHCGGFSGGFGRCF